MIKAVIFDFFGVIYSDEYWRFVRHDKQSESVFKDYANDVNLGRMPWQAFVQRIAEATGRTPQEVNELYSGERIDPRVLGLAVHLHENYKTALLTNAHHQLIDDILAQHKLEQVFDELIISSREGVIKPSPRIYEIALERLGVKPEEAVFIDDIESNARAAAEQGIKTVVFTDFESCKQQLDVILSTG